MTVVPSVLSVVDEAMRASGGPDDDRRHGITNIVVEPEAIEVVAEQIATLLAAPARIALIVDPVLITGAHDVDIKERAAHLLGEGGYDVLPVVLDDGHDQLHASEPVLTDAAKRAAGVDAIVSIGGGTITDIGKMTARALDSIPHLAVQTAGSVDGFTDDVSVILIKGVKRTVPSRWPDVVIADTSVIQQAPEAMNRAGFGELMSMLVAPADWRLANILGFDDSFDPRMVGMLEFVGRGIDEWSVGLPDRDPTSIDRLVRALDVRGIATGLAGTTALLSGVEHLVSHLLDIHHGAKGLRMGAHGAQVGAASVLAAEAWQLLQRRMTDEPVGELAPVRAEAVQERVFAAFGPLSADGSLAEECWADVSRKVSTWNANLPTIAAALADWASVAPELDAMVTAPDVLSRSLQAAGAPATMRELDPSVDEDLAFWALRNCGYMRNRLSVVDVLDFLGWWDDDAARDILVAADQHRSGVSV